MVRRRTYKKSRSNSKSSLRRKTRGRKRRVSKKRGRQGKGTRRRRRRRTVRGGKWNVSDEENYKSSIWNRWNPVKRQKHKDYKRAEEAAYEEELERSEAVLQQNIKKEKDAMEHILTMDEFDDIKKQLDLNKIYSNLDFKDLTEEQIEEKKRPYEFVVNRYKNIKNITNELSRTSTKDEMIKREIENPNFRNSIEDLEMVLEYIKNNNLKTIDEAKEHFNKFSTMAEKDYDTSVKNKVLNSFRKFKDVSSIEEQLQRDKLLIKPSKMLWEK